MRVRTDPPHAEPCTRQSCQMKRELSALACKSGVTSYRHSCFRGLAQSAALPHPLSASRPVFGILLLQLQYCTAPARRKGFCYCDGGKGVPKAWRICRAKEMHEVRRARCRRQHIDIDARLGNTQCLTHKSPKIRCRSAMLLSIRSF